MRDSRTATLCRYQAPGDCRPVQKINPALDQNLTLNVAMMMNPNLAEKYLGYSVRYDAIDEGKRILMNYQVPR